jgi:hypothetical protein
MRNRTPEPAAIDIDAVKAKINRSSVLIIEGFLGLMLFLLVVGMFTDSCNGPAGLQGLQGVQGVVGPAGPAGDVTAVAGIAGHPGDVGPAGAMGIQGIQGIEGPAGPAGEDGEDGEDTGITGPIGPIGPVGPAGPKGATGELGFLNPSPSSLLLPNVNQILFFHSSGVLVENPGLASAGAALEIPNRMSRRTIDLTKKGAIRLQWAHTLQSAAIKIRLEYQPAGMTIWRVLVPFFGADLTPYANQTSGWYGIAAEDTKELFVRVMVEGDGVLDPGITYVEVDAR